MTAKKKEVEKEVEARETKADKAEKVEDVRRDTGTNVIDPSKPMGPRDPNIPDDARDDAKNEATARKNQEAIDAAKRDLSKEELKDAQDEPAPNPGRTD